MMSLRYSKSSLRSLMSMPRVFTLVLASLFGVGTCVMVLMTTAETGWAEKRESMKKRLEREKSIRYQKLMRAQRLELGLSVGSSLNDVYQRSAPIGVNANYFWSDSWGIGAHAFFALQSETALGEQVKIRRPTRANNNSFTSVGLGLGADLLYTPIHGKFSPLGITAIRYDLGLTGGVGLLQVTTDGEPGFKPAPAFGINSRFFIHESLAISVFYKAYIYSYADHVTIVSGKKQINESWGSQSFGGIMLSFLTGKARVSAE